MQRSRRKCRAQRCEVEWRLSPKRCGGDGHGVALLGLAVAVAVTRVPASGLFGGRATLIGLGRSNSRSAWPFLVAQFTVSPGPQLTKCQPACARPDCCAPHFRRAAAPRAWNLEAAVAPTGHPLPTPDRPSASRPALHSGCCTLSYPSENHPAALAAHQHLLC